MIEEEAFDFLKIIRKCTDLGKYNLIVCNYFLNFFIQYVTSSCVIDEMFIKVPL